MAKVLIVDDDENLTFFLASNLRDKGFEVDTVDRGEAALEKMEAGDDLPDAILLDIRMPDINGLEVLERIKALHEDTIIIMITGHGGIKEAMRSIELGAFDFVTKPFNTEKMVIVLEKAFKNKELTNEVRDLKRKLREQNILSELMGVSHAIKRVIKQVELVAPTKMTVIIEGASGTGKEVIANMVHEKGKATDNEPFVALDCGAIPDTLVESELFGYEKGAFTGAESRKAGAFEEANGGTLFLDEITNLPRAAQAKLLRIIQEKKVRHLGGDKTIDIDVRIIVASNVILTEAVEAGGFRDDLYYRLNEFTLKLPTLKEREEDIPVLARYFLDKANNQMGKDIKEISPEAMKTLMDYDWPGNVRELQNVIKKSVLLSESERLEYGALPTKLRCERNVDVGAHGYEALDISRILEAGASLQEITQDIIDDVERQVIEYVLGETGDNKTRAAKILQVDRKTLYSKMNALNIDY